MTHKTDLHAVPLASLPAVVLDTETTGLDTARDRVIEIGAVRLIGADLTTAEDFQTFVNPNVKIPREATAIHGLSTAHVKDAPEFPEAIALFNDWAGDTVIIGYSIAFDLAMLRNECKAAGIEWQEPPSFDVRYLLMLVEPQSVASSLEAAAERFGIDMVDRHRALADAKLTARIFLAALPALRAKGIRTFGEADSAIKSLIARRERGADGRPGFESTSGIAAATEVAQFPRLDSFPYRHRVCDLMSAPAKMLGTHDRADAALQAMMSYQISSVFVMPSDAEASHGIITERDILRAIANTGAAALEQPAVNLANGPLVSVNEQDFVYVALARMAKHHIRHLAVVDQSGAIVGALSARDLLGQRADDAVALGRMIEEANTPEQVGQVWLLLPRVAKALCAEDVDPRDVASVVSRELRALTRKACELAHDELRSGAAGDAPERFTVMILGSGGRGESLLAMDQDNAIVYEASENKPDCDAWLERFARRVSDILDMVGVSYCKGGVMASNAAWRMDSVQWREKIRSWMLHPRAQDILNCDIFFDATPVYGADEVADDLRTDAMAYARDSRGFLSLLALNASDFAPAFGWFGRIKTERGRIDVKRAGLMPVFSAARVVALRHGLTGRSTLERLEAFNKLGLADSDLVSDLIESHRISLGCILRQQLRDLDRGIKLSNSVAPAELGGRERSELKWALQRVPSVASILGTPIDVL